MKLLVFSDMHLHSWRNFGLDMETGLPKRLVDQQKVLAQIASLAKEQKVDGVLSIGDLFHNVGTILTECLNTADRFFKVLKQADIPFYFVRGNHDLTNRKDPKWYHYSGNIFNPSTPPPNIRLVDFNEVIDYEKIKGFDIVALHQTPLGAKLDNYTFDEGFNWKKLASQNKLVLCGHIHLRQHLSDNCIIIGSPMHLSFGDRGDCGVYLVNSDTGKANFIKLDYPEFLTVETVDQTKDDRNYYRVLTPTNKEKINSNTIVSVNTTNFKERLKADTLDGIVREWLLINHKPETYIELINDLLGAKLDAGKKIYPGVVTKVGIQDWGSIEKAAYEVKKGFTLIVGNNDVFDSNGSGKTTLWEAFYWCLSGETTKGVSGDEVIRNRPTQQKDCKVTSVLTDKEGSYKISRSRKEGLNIFRLSNIPDSVPIELTAGLKQVDRQKMLDAILGFDKTIFMTSCYFSQENLLMLTGLGDTERTTLITDLLGFENYNILQDKVKEKIELQKEEISKVEIKLSSVERNLLICTTTLPHNEEYVKNISQTLSERVQEIEKLKESILKFVVIIGVDVSKDLIEKRDNLRWDIQTQKELTNNIALKDIPRIVSEIATYKEQIKTHTTNISLLSIEINNLETLEKGSRCDKCGSNVDEEHLSIFINEKKEKQLSFAREKTTIEEYLLRRIEVQEKANISLLKYKAELEEKEKSLGALNLQILDLGNIKKNNEAELKTKQEKLVELEKNYPLLLIQREEYKIALEQAKENIKKAQAEIAGGKKIIEAHKVNIEILEFWKIAFSSKGIRSLLLDRFCNEFNLIVNEYLSDISTGSMSLTMSPISQTKAGEDRNRVSMNILLDGIGNRRYESLSGGEKRRVDVSLCFAMSKYLATKYQMGEHGLLGIVILDEVFSGIDATGKEALTTVLYNEGKHKAVFVIDHGSNLESYADTIWTVKKEKGISSLEIH